MYSSPHTGLPAPQAASAASDAGARMRTIRLKLFAQSKPIVNLISPKCRPQTPAAAFQKLASRRAKADVRLPPTGLALTDHPDSGHRRRVPAAAVAYSHVLGAYTCLYARSW